jgi:hypothetical protein
MIKNVFATPCPGQKMGEGLLEYARREEDRICLHPIDPS